MDDLKQYLEQVIDFVISGVKEYTPRMKREKWIKIELNKEKQRNKGGVISKYFLYKNDIDIDVVDVTTDSNGEIEKIDYYLWATNWEGYQVSIKIINKHINVDNIKIVF